MAFTLSPLPYAHDALEPHIDTLTMQIHHGKYHQAYVDNLQPALFHQLFEIMVAAIGIIHSSGKVWHPIQEAPHQENWLTQSTRLLALLMSSKQNLLPPV